jgi:tetratricopeptide (TPR) repeat protein
LQGSAFIVSVDYKYRAFISYSHKDEKWASWLHNALETFKVPKHLVGQETAMGIVPERMGKVFRDREELSSSASLGAELTQALEDSACQIVICSPNAAKSHWTNEEVLTYKRLGRESRVFCLIVDGEPGTDQECFPPAVRFQMGADGVLSDEPAEPIAADARPHADGKFNAKLKLIAGMLGVGFDDLKQRELVRQKRRKAIVASSSFAGVFVACALAYSIYLNLTAIPPVEMETVSVLIADFENTTGDPLFDGILEEALQVGIEGAPFITTYERSDALRLANELSPGEVLDEAAARLVSVREEIGLVLAGRIEEDNGRYRLSARALEPQEGEVVANVRATARNKSAVLAAVGDLAGELREELGDVTLDGEVSPVADTFTAGSLEAARAYVDGLEKAYQGNHEAAVVDYQEAVRLDPNFGKAFASLALSASRVGQTEVSEQAWQKALSLMDTMTEREKLRTLGVYYASVTRNFDSAIDNFAVLVEKYPADAAGLNNLAVSYFYTLDFASALEVGGKLVDIYPSSQLYRSNFALYAMYATEFEKAVVESQKVIEQDPRFYKAYLPQAIAALDTDDFEAAESAYSSMSEAGVRGASLANVGLADMNIYRGEFRDALRTLETAVAVDEEKENHRAAARKYAMLAEALLNSGDSAAALDAAQQAIELDSGEAVSVSTAIVFLTAGEFESAEAIAEKLVRQVQPQRRAYGLMIKAMRGLADENVVLAIDNLNAALDLSDLWLIRLQLGKAYLHAGYAAEAIAEFEGATSRRGEASAIFLDDVPTFRYLAELPYWLARAKLDIGMRESASEDLKKFLELRPHGGPHVEVAIKLQSPD